MVACMDSLLLAKVFHVQQRLVTFKTEQLQAVYKAL